MVCIRIGAKLSSILFPFSAPAYRYVSIYYLFLRRILGNHVMAIILLMINYTHTYMETQSWRKNKATGHYCIFLPSLFLPFVTFLAILGFGQKMFIFGNQFSKIDFIAIIKWIWYHKLFFLNIFFIYYWFWPTKHFWAKFDLTQGFYSLNLCEHYVPCMLFWSKFPTHI